MGASDEWMSAADFGRSLEGFGINLLVSDIDVAILFAESILLAEILYSDDMFGCVRRGDIIWQYHSNLAYEGHALFGFVRDEGGGSLLGRGAGAEFRFYDIDPDLAEVRARGLGYTVLAGAMDKPHGLRECYILDSDGYCWVLSRALV